MEGLYVQSGYLKEQVSQPRPADKSCLGGE